MLGISEADAIIISSSLFGSIYFYNSTKNFTRPTNMLNNLLLKISCVLFGTTCGLSIVTITGSIVSHNFKFLKA